MVPILAYWDIRGLAEPIRYLLHYVGEKFEDKRYAYDEWFGVKFQLGLDFPNLPYYIDDKVKLTQSKAILRYLARRHKLAGSNEEEQIRAELLEQQIQDFLMSLGRIATCPKSEFEKQKAEFLKTVPTQLKLLSDFLGDRKWFAGDNITYVDFMAYDSLDFYWLFIPRVLDDFPNLKQYVERFEKLPALQSYLKSPAYKRWPIFGPPAVNFGFHGQEPKRE